MNREQKLALIIGFAVILVVGVLVSDHLSAAQGLDLADATEGDLGRVEARPAALLPDPGSSAGQYAAAQPREAIGPPPVDRPVQTRPVGESSAREDDVVQIAQGPGVPLGDAMRHAADRQATAEGSPRPVNRLREFGERIANGLGAVQPATVLDASPRPPTGAVEPQVQEVPARAPVRHTVAANESLYKIAARYLGDGNRWREIAAANRGKVAPDGGVRAGASLVIPNAPAQLPRTEQARPGPPGKPASGPTTYTVAKNDSLGQIAQRLLGSVRYMDDIIRANPDKIDDPDDIRAGMVLNIPARS